MSQRRRAWPRMRMASAVLMIGALAGCIQVKAPDKPIEINLNVKIQQEVFVHVVQDTQQLVKDRPDLFPE